MNKGTCPACGKEIDLEDEKAVLAHMEIDDEPHKKHLERAKTEMFLSQMCNTGLIRPIRRGREVKYEK